MSSTNWNDGWSVTRATDFRNNADVKIDFTAIDWTNYDMSEFKFKQLSDLFSNGDLADDLSARVRDDWLDYFKNEAATKLPEVCEPGQECRQAIINEAQTKIKEDW